MLVKLGARRDQGDVVDLMLECHERIRRFCAMAVQLAAAVGPKDDEVRESARAVRRYFAEALPLHVADEEDDLVPMLAGRDPEVDAALVAMANEHDEHAADIERLVELCAALDQDPASHATVRGEFATLATQLSDGFASHLDREERVLFPALRRLPDSDLATLRQRIRARREGRRATD
jgi:iron-sulfur cluster repair protein YtfE (RIC family)